MINKGVSLHAIEEKLKLDRKENLKKIKKNLDQLKIKKKNIQQKEEVKLKEL